MSDAERDSFLAEQMVMQCATVGPRGMPHLVPLWFVTSGAELKGWTYAKSQKAKNLERNPRATIGIEDGIQYQELRGVMFECDVTIESGSRPRWRGADWPCSPVLRAISAQRSARWWPSRHRSGWASPSFPFGK